MTTMSTGRSISRSTWLLAAAGLLMPLAACASSAEREAYFESRTAVVAAQPGSGATRVVLWPASPWGRSTVAVADRRSTSDISPILPATDSTR
jgi:hypothetical protein